MASPDRLEAAFEPLLCLCRLRLLQLGLVELEVLPSTLPGSCELMLNIELGLHTQLHPCANLTELCLVTANPSEVFFAMDLLPCLPGLRSLVVKAQRTLVHWHGTAPLPMLQSLKCVSINHLFVCLGSELHHSFTGRLSLATFGKLLLSYTNLQSEYGQSHGLHPGLCTSIASFCALGERQYDKSYDYFDRNIRSLANARRLDGGREWAPKLGRVQPWAHGVRNKGNSLEVIVTDAEGLEWISTQYRAMCRWFGAPHTPVRNVDIEWDS